MRKQTSFALFLALVVSQLDTVQAQTIIGFGMSDQAGGFALNKQLAQASANDFLAEQASVAAFRYSKENGKTVFERLSKSELRDITVTKSENFGKNGAIVWLSAEVAIPSYSDEQCRVITQSIRNAEQTNRMVLRVMEKAIPDLLRPSLKKSTNITGVTYLRNLSVAKTWYGAFKIKTEVCVAQLSLL